ncbi:MAG: MFS transporter, partial [Myxococcales bacterium]|nr:MFS transporter [Myxococcales bacterium]
MAYEPRHSPDHNNTGWPPGVPYIIGNEGCERFSYYGMRAILTVFLAQYLYIHHPVFSQDAERTAKAHYHVFAGAVYLFPLLGAVIADRLFGKYRTILWLSMVYVAGHAVLAVSEHSVTGFWIGLGLIAVGSGGIKPNVSAHVG